MILAKSWIFQLFPFNTRPLSWCEKWFHMEIFYCLKSWGRSSEAKNINKKFAEWPLSWDMSHYDKKTEKTEKLPKVFCLTLSNGHKAIKVCCETSLFMNQVQKNLVSMYTVCAYYDKTKTNWELVFIVKTRTAPTPVWIFELTVKFS